MKKPAAHEAHRDPSRTTGSDVPDVLAMVELFKKPTPFEPLARLSRSLGRSRPLDVWIKREDLMTAGMGGNKLRNLEFLVAEARAAGADTLVAHGRPSVNHCRLTAAAAARVGMHSVLVLSGPYTAVAGANDWLAELFGAQLIYVDEALSMPTEIGKILEALRRKGQHPFLVPPGASGPVGASGQVWAGFELAQQLEERAVAPDYLFVAVANGGTYAGLRVGLWLAGWDTTVVGVPTYLAHATSEWELREHLVGLMAELRRLWQPRHSEQTREWRDEIVFDDFTGWLPPGVVAPEADAAARLLGATEAIAIDPIYTARALSGLIAWSNAGRLDGKSVVFWDGGGTPALFEAWATSVLASR